MVATWKIVAAALLIFAAGVVTGGIAAGASYRTARWHPARQPHPQPATNAPPPHAAGIAPARVSTNRNWGPPNAVARIETFRRLAGQLDLEPARRERVETLAGEASERIRAIWSPVAPRIQLEVRDLRKQIAGELTAEQKERFDALVAVVDKRTPVPASGGPTNSVPAASR